MVVCCGIVGRGLVFFFLFFFLLFSPRESPWLSSHSVCATVSKILERYVHSHFWYFLTNRGLLTDFQFGFRWFRSCELSVINLSDNILDIGIEAF